MLLSPLFLEDKRKKPERWGLDKGLTDPEWWWFHRYATFFSPLWGAGAPYDLIQRQFASNVVGEWGVSQRGRCFVTDASGEYISFDAKAGYQLDADIDFFAFAAVIITGYSGTYPTVMAVRSQFNANGMWELYFINPPSTGYFTFRVGSNKTLGFPSAWPGTGFHTFSITRRVGGTYELFVDAVSLGTQSDATTPAAASLPLTIGDLHPDASGNNILGQWLFSAIIKGYAPTVSQVEQLHYDTFGPLRMAYGPEVWAQVVTGSPWYAYAQQ